jgi:hypothetical protein
VALLVTSIPLERPGAAVSASNRAIEMVIPETEFWQIRELLRRVAGLGTRNGFEKRQTPGVQLG